MNQIKELLDQGMIRPIKSPCSSHVVLVQKRMDLGECILIIGI